MPSGMSGLGMTKLRISMPSRPMRWMWSFTFPWQLAPFLKTWCYTLHQCHCWHRMFGSLLWFCQVPTNPWNWDQTFWAVLLTSHMTWTARKVFMIDSWLWQILVLDWRSDSNLFHFCDKRSCPIGTRFWNLVSQSSIHIIYPNITLINGANRVGQDDYCKGSHKKNTE